MPFIALFIIKFTTFISNQYYIFALYKCTTMKNCLSIYILLSLFLGMVEEGYANRTDSLVLRDTAQHVAIRFDVALTEVDSAYADNRRAIAWLDSMLADAGRLSDIGALTVTSYVLPTGNSKFNTWLAAMRTVTVKEFLKLRYPHLPISKVRTLRVDNEAEIRRAMLADPKLDRSDVQISWSYPVVVRRMVGDKLMVDQVREVVEITVEKAFASAASASEVAPEAEPKPKERVTVLAIKNNLLYDLALAPNLEIEVPLGQRWSLNTEYKCPWWLSHSRDFCYQLLSGGIEARCWLGNRRHRSRLTGHFIGLYAEGGVYDFQFGSDGYHGKYYGAGGVSYGYTHPLGRNLALEFSLGMGYLTTEYRKYTPYKEDLIWTSSGRYNFIGPTKAKVSLVWFLKTRR